MLNMYKYNQKHLFKKLFLFQIIITILPVGGGGQLNPPPPFFFNIGQKPVELLTNKFFDSLSICKNEVYIHVYVVYKFKPPFLKDI